MTTYAILAADDPSTLHARERDWCETLTDGYAELATDGLVVPGADTQPPASIYPDALARAVAADRRSQNWCNGDVIYVLADPTLLDARTGNAYRRTTRVVLERFDATVRYPYDTLDAPEKRAAWLTECLDAGEIVPVGKGWSRSVQGVNPAQAGLGTF